MDILAQAVEKIIEEQEGIVGPVALEQAQKVPGLEIDWKTHKIEFQGNSTDILAKLVENYQHLFGRASVEVCRDAVRKLRSKIPADKLPASLQ